jgi:hypothetical protein
LALPPIVHYAIEPLPLPKPPTPPRYTEHYEQSNTEHSSANSESKNSKSLWERITDDAVAFTTLCLVGVTAILAASTIGLWIVTASAGKRQSRDMKRSIRVAERALTELERPFVYVDVTEPGFQLVSSRHQAGYELERGTFQISVINFGRTPANLIRIEYHLGLAPRGGIIDPIDPRMIGGRELPVGTVSATDHPYSESTRMRLNFFDEEKDIVERKRSIWLVGFIRYDDIFAAKYITGFTKIFDLLEGNFVARGGEQYNYARAEKPEEIPEPSSRG